ncbi:murein L,D-transpeptidase catalytic domain family protein [Sphingomonas hankyongi]|uniref:Murein L,D-transpeptidase catalytic domain family protein n=1 Tax=Sphingomonas hankyongi TaxID=2908209 RepID=A0ABT0S037_9SPHN|nr:murein L,D-transpeptidase catalytic domain family protein [Sphingomonas hankyongi]MCL6729224.1 murein L,D-transpeptidase catalytic domain family protein [Sphingomonas hankyongi]
MLRLGAIGAAGAMLSSAASSSVLPSLIMPGTHPGAAPVPPSPSPAQILAPTAPAGIDPQLFQRAKFALDQHKIGPRDAIGIVDFSKPSSDPRFHVVDLRSGVVDTYRVAHGRGSDPDHSGFVERFSNDFGSHATSNGTYTTADYYNGKYGLSMKVRGLDWSNYNAEPRAIVIHNAWYAEPEMIATHGKLGRSEGCFAFSRDDQWSVMRKLAGGRMIFADKLQTA